MDISSAANSQAFAGPYKGPAAVKGENAVSQAGQMAATTANERLSHIKSIAPPTSTFPNTMKELREATPRLLYNLRNLNPKDLSNFLQSFGDQLPHELGETFRQAARQVMDNITGLADVSTYTDNIATQWNSVISKTISEFFSKLADQSSGSSKEGKHPLAEARDNAFQTMLGSAENNVVAGFTAALCKFVQASYARSIGADDKDEIMEDAKALSLKALQAAPNLISGATPGKAEIYIFFSVLVNCITQKEDKKADGSPVKHSLSATFKADLKDRFEKESVIGSVIALINECNKDNKGDPKVLNERIKTFSNLAVKASMEILSTFLVGNADAAAKLQQGFASDDSITAETKITKAVISLSADIIDYLRGEATGTQRLDLDKIMQKAIRSLTDDSNPVDTDLVSEETRLKDTVTKTFGLTPEQEYSVWETSWYFM